MGGRPYLVFGYLDDCGHCHAAAPAVVQVAREARVYCQPAPVSRGGKFPVPVEGFPALAFLAGDGRVLGSIVGLTRARDMRQWMAGVLAEEAQRRKDG